MAQRLGAAILGTAVAVLPVLTLGALATLIRPDLQFSETRLGLAAAAFFAASAVFSLPAGTLAERMGPTRTCRWAIGIGVVALLGIALFAQSWVTLLPWMMLGGSGNALAQVATNGLVASVMPPGRNGIAFGAKQSAVPLASLGAGIAVPALGLTVGWRWAFACAALLAIPALVLLRGKLEDISPRTAGGGRLRPADRRPLILLAISAGLGAGAVNSMMAFYVDSVVNRGEALGTAGLFFAIGGCSGILVRVVGGWWSDHRQIRRLPMVAVLLAIGSLALFALSVVEGGLLLPVTIVVFGAGWGWNGLLLAAVVDAYPHAPSAGTSFTQAGLYAGGVISPTVFGILAQHVSYAAAWTAAAITLMFAAVMVLGCSRLMDPKPPTKETETMDQP
jgi:MFS family permease